MTLEQLLAVFGYSQAWVDAGVVSDDLVREQYEVFCDSEDKNLEHYRCGAFHFFLRELKSLSDAAVQDLVRLHDQEAGGMDLRYERVLRLVQHGLLTDDQLDNIESWSGVSSPHLAKHIRRRKFKRRIAQEGISLAVFQVIKESGDRDLHDLLLLHEELTREHLIWLEEFAGNKSVRNRSRQALRSRRFRAR